MPRGIYDRKAAAERRKARLLAEAANADPFGFPDEAPSAPAPAPAPKKDGLVEMLAKMPDAVALPAKATTPPPNANDEIALSMVTELMKLNQRFARQDTKLESDEERLERLVRAHDAWKAAKHLFSGSPEEREYFEFCESKRKGCAASVRATVRMMMKTDAQEK